MSRSLAADVSASRVDEVRQAARALLRHPLLLVGGPDSEAFGLVRRHAGELREWFGRNTGWRLDVDTEVARLVKVVPQTDDATFPARDVRTKQPFTRRRYVLLCLALAALECADAQITLGRLAEHVVFAAADPQLADAGVVFRLDRREERSDLAAVVRLLLDLGVLRRVAGDEEAYVARTGDVLYDVARRVLSTLLASRRGPSTVDAGDVGQRIAALTEELIPDTESLRNQATRQDLTRRLLDEPVLYVDELDEAARGYLTGQRAAITGRIAELTGLVAEVRAEGIAMVDPADDLTDVRMPESGTEGHVTLLVADYLAQQTDRAVPLGELQEKVRQLAGEHRGYWRRDATQPHAEVPLTAVALDRLEALRLLRRTPLGVVAQPALARHTLTAATIQGQLEADQP